MSQRAVKRRAIRLDPAGCVEVHGWQLTPEGGLIRGPERTAVIADVHLGYEWARGSAGDCVPSHTLAETIGKLDRLLNRGPIERLVVAGDLVESARPCSRTAADVARLCDWIGEREIDLVLLRGNHDRSLRWALGRGGSKASHWAETIEIAGWTIAHGDRPITAPRTITGHHHPVVRLAGRTCPCFLAAESAIVLSAFSPNAAGLDVLSAGLPLAWNQPDLHCLASTGQEVLDFGPLTDLGTRLRSSQALQTG